MADRAYLTEAMPMCVIWGDQDRVIPVSHAARAAELAPKARVEVVPNAGHFPHKDHPERFVKILNDFVRTTSPASYSRARWRRLLEEGAHARASLSVVEAPTAEVRIADTRGMAEAPYALIPDVVGPGAPVVERAARAAEAKERS